MKAFLQKYLAQFDLEAVLMKLLSLLVLYLGFLVVKKVVRALVRHALEVAIQSTGQDLGRKKTIIRLVDNALNYALYFFLLYGLLSILGLPVSSLLAGAGVAGVAIGLGAQGFLSDVVNGFFILIERQFDVGETVQLTNGAIRIAGVVRSVGIRTTQVTDSDGTLHFIPNRNILLVSNRSRGDMRAQVDLPLATTVDLGRVLQVLEAVTQQALPAHPQIKSYTFLGPQLDTSGQFIYRIQFLVENGQESIIYHRFYGLYQEALKEAGIDLAPLGFSLSK